MEKVAIAFFILFLALGISLLANHRINSTPILPPIYFSLEEDSQIVLTCEIPQGCSETTSCDFGP